MDSNGGRVLGVKYWDANKNEELKLNADAVILATGIYTYECTNTSTHMYIRATLRRTQAN